MGHTIEGMRDKFGALLDAFEYGAPPHGGIALGIDRWAARLAEQENIREVMAFPKTGAGSDLMLGAPSPAIPPSSRSSASLSRLATPEGTAERRTVRPGERSDAARPRRRLAARSATTRPASGGGPPAGSGGPS